MTEAHRLPTAALLSSAGAFALALLAIRARASSRKSAVKELDYTFVEIEYQKHLAGIQELAKHTYGGHDWIASAYDSWFAPFYVRLGIECRSTGDNELAGLFVLRPNVMDSVGCLEALRVHPKHRGRGLSHRLVAEMIKRVKHLRQTDPAWTWIDHLWYTTYNQNVLSQKVALKAGFTIVQEIPFMMVTEDEGNAENDFISRRGKGSMKTFHDDAAAALKSTRGSMGLFRKLEADEIYRMLVMLEAPRLYQDWKPYKVTPYNVESVVTIKRGVCYALDEGLGGVSFGLFRADHQGVICILTIYWWNDASKGLAEGHSAGQDVAAHISYWRKLCEANKVTSQYVSYPWAAHDELFKVGFVFSAEPTRELILELPL